MCVDSPSKLYLDIVSIGLVMLEPLETWPAPHNTARTPSCDQNAISLATRNGRPSNRATGTLYRLILTHTWLGIKLQPQCLLLSSTVTDNSTLRKICR